MKISELKDAREALHEELNDLLLQFKPKEQAIRAKIKEIQIELYKREMGPVKAKLEFDLAELDLSDEVRKQKEAKLSAINEQL